MIATKNKTFRALKLFNLESFEALQLSNLATASLCFHGTNMNQWFHFRHGNKMNNYLKWKRCYMTRWKKERKKKKKKKIKTPLPPKKSYPQKWYILIQNKWKKMSYKNFKISVPTFNMQIKWPYLKTTFFCCWKL